MTGTMTNTVKRRAVDERVTVRAFCYASLGQAGRNMARRQFSCNAPA